MRRSDKDKFEKVDMAIKLANKGQISSAAKLCEAVGVPIEVAHRVILKPANRRKKQDKK